MIFHLSIDYSETSPDDSYRGVVLHGGDPARELQRWMTGNPQEDWSSYMDWALANKPVVLMSSSVDHFLHDALGWRMIEDKHGREVLVPEDRPQWLAYKAAIAAGLSEELADEAARKVMETNAKDN